jgi:hypothetical protein
MISARVSPTLCSPKQVAQVGRVVVPLLHTKSSLLGYTAGLRLCSASPYHGQQDFPGPRSFSTTSVARLRDFFPPKETGYIRETPPAWSHHGYTEEQMLAVQVGHRKPKTVGDWLAWRLIRLCRWGMDFVTGLKSDQQVDKKNPTTAITASKPLTEAQWVRRETLSANQDRRETPGHG